MNRPRKPYYQRRDPQRTGPIRNAGGALRDDDAASRGVHEGYRMINEQIRRGQRTAQTLGEEPWSGDPAYGSYGYPGSGPYPHPYPHVERPSNVESLVKELLHLIGSGFPSPWKLAELILRLELAVISNLAGIGFGALGGHHYNGRYPYDHCHDDDHYNHHHYYPQDTLCDDTAFVEDDFDQSYGWIQEELWPEEGRGESWDWPATPSFPTTIRSTVPIPVYVSSHERTEIDLDLPAGSQPWELAVEPPVGAGEATPPAPPFEAVFIALADGPAILRIEVPRDLPAGRYLRRILSRATGEPVGNLAVQVGTVSKAGPKPRATRAKKV